MFSLPALFLALLAGTAQPSVQSTEPVLRAQLAGKLLLPDGRPAQGALVISSLGGQAESLGDGSFALDLEYSADEREVQLTAVLTPLGSAASLSASLHCTLPLHGGALALGARTLGAAAGLPEWLPTFGGEPGTSGQIVSLAVLDEGTGPVLYAAGSRSVRYLANRGLLSERFLDDSYVGDASAWLAADGAIIQQGYSTNEVYKY